MASARVRPYSIVFLKCCYLLLGSVLTQYVSARVRILSGLLPLTLVINAHLDGPSILVLYTQSQRGQRFGETRQVVHRCQIYLSILLYEPLAKYRKGFHRHDEVACCRTFVCIL